MYDKFYVHEKLYVHKIVAVNLSKIYFLKNAKKTCKSNNRHIKSRLNNHRVRKDRRNFHIFNTYFTNVTKGLQLQQVDESQSFENEESCWLIRETYGDEKFSFKSISKNDTIESSQKITFKQSINIK